MKLLNRQHMSVIIEGENKPGMSNFASKLGQVSPNGTNLELFAESKCAETDIKK